MTEIFCLSVWDGVMCHLAILLNEPTNENFQNSSPSPTADTSLLPCHIQQNGEIPLCWENCHLMSSVLNLYQHSHHYLEEICNICNLTNKLQREVNCIYSESYFICLQLSQLQGAWIQIKATHIYERPCNFDFFQNNLECIWNK